jgi:hypothetical protein
MRRVLPVGHGTLLTHDSIDSQQFQEIEMSENFRGVTKQLNNDVNNGSP